MTADPLDEFVSGLKGLVTEWFREAEWGNGDGAMATAAATAVSDLLRDYAAATGQTVHCNAGYEPRTRGEGLPTLEYSSACTCGWRSEWRRTSSAVMADLADHLDRP